MHLKSDKKMSECQRQIVKFLEKICNDFRLSPMSDEEIAQWFIISTKSRLGIDYLAEQIKTIRRLILKNQSASVFFKIGLLFLAQEPVKEGFELSIVEVAKYQLDFERKLISFAPMKSSSGFGFEREGAADPSRSFTCPINPYPWNVVEIDHLMRCLQYKVRILRGYTTLEILCINFKEKEDCRRTVEQLNAKAYQYLTVESDTVDNFVLERKCQMLHKCQIPLPANILTELYKVARFQVDQDNRLTYLRTGLMTFGEPNPTLIMRVPKLNIQIFLENIAKTSGMMSIEQLTDEFLSQYAFYNTKEFVLCRILKLLDTRLTRTSMDPITRIQLFFKTQVCLNLNFERSLNKLRLGILVVDKDGKIQSFVSLDGKVNLNRGDSIDSESAQERKRKMDDASFMESPLDYPPKRNTRTERRYEPEEDDLDYENPNLPGTSSDFGHLSAFLTVPIPESISPVLQNEVPNETLNDMVEPIFDLVEPKLEKELEDMTVLNDVEGAFEAVDVPSNELIDVKNEEPGLEIIDRVTSSKDIFKWFRASLKTLSNTNFSDIVQDVENQLTETDDSDVIELGKLAEIFKDTYHGITVTCYERPEESIVASELVTLLRYALNYLDLPDVSNLQMEMEDFMKTYNDPSYRILMDDLQRVLNGLFVELIVSTKKLV